MVMEGDGAAADVEMAEWWQQATEDAGGRGEVGLRQGWSRLRVSGEGLLGHASTKKWASSRRLSRPRHIALMEAFSDQAGLGQSPIRAHNINWRRFSRYERRSAGMRLGQRATVQVTCKGATKPAVLGGTACKGCCILRITILVSRVDRAFHGSI